MYLEGILVLTSFLSKMLVLINAFKMYPVSDLTTLHPPLLIRIKKCFLASVLFRMLLVIQRLINWHVYYMHFFQTKMKQFSWEAKHKKMETHVGNRTLFMLHGDECAHMKGQYFVERIQINMIFAAALHILYLFNLLLLFWGRGWLLYCMFVKTTAIQM